MAFPMSATELRYQFIINSTDDHPTPFLEEELDGDVASAWTLDSTSTMDYLDMVLPSIESILEEMTGVDRPWEDLHHRSYFLPPLQEVESRFSNLPTSDVCMVSNPLAPAHICAKGNMSVISKTVPINISRNPNVIENVFIKDEFSPEEIQIYTNLFKEFRMYSLGLMKKCLVLIHPSFRMRSRRMKILSRFVRSFSQSILGK